MTVLYASPVRRAISFFATPAPSISSSAARCVSNVDGRPSRLPSDRCAPLQRGTAVRVRDRGVITLPKPLRERYGLGVGNVLDVVDLNGVSVLSPRASVVPELAAETERLRLDVGLSTEDLLASLSAERERATRERYGDAFVDGLATPTAEG